MPSSVSKINMNPGFAVCITFSVSRKRQSIFSSLFELSQEWLHKRLSFSQTSMQGGEVGELP